ncbi:MAG: response regulator [Pseudomonadota bacterium]
MVRKLRVLVVDDDTVLLNSLREILEADGHAVTAADGGQAGIDAFMAARGGSEPFDVVLTDLGMPYVDGGKVIASVRAASPKTPIILLTGWGQQLHNENEAPLQVDHLLGKPPRIRELRDALLRCCG